jgi:hypothetical protein
MQLVSNILVWPPPTEDNFDVSPDEEDRQAQAALRGRKKRWLPSFFF